MKKLTEQEEIMSAVMGEAIDASPVCAAEIRDGSRVYGCVVFSGDDYQIALGEHGNTFINAHAAARYLLRRGVPVEHIWPIVEAAEV